MLRRLTRSIEVICLAQFFALIPRQLYRDRELSIIYEHNMAALPGRRSNLTFPIRRDCKNCAIPGGPPGLFPCSQPGQSTGGLRQVTQTPSIAVPLGVTVCLE
jgi:hypothetical protein